MASDRDEARAHGGFHSYADDTPRAPPIVVDAYTVQPERRSPDKAAAPTGAAATIAAAAGAGAAVGILAALALGWIAMRRPDPPPVPPATAAARPLQVVVTEPPPPPPVPRAAERLEVLPTAPPGPPPARVPLAQAVIPVAPAPGVVTAGVVTAPRPPDPLPRTAPSAGDAAREASAAAGPAPRRFNACDDAPTRAMAMVCRDLRLAEADRRMKRAYRAALAAGVPERVLAEDQADWLQVREDAARVGRRAVADIYRQRTRALQAMAEDGRY